ncbi:hypothetical protein JHK86_034152 [Glycine max]|nr:hypothetical protein JHK86_034152 [Glycine max]
MEDVNPNESNIDEKYHSFDEEGLPEFFNVIYELFKRNLTMGRVDTYDVYRLMLQLSLLKEKTPVANKHFTSIVESIL